MRFHLRNFKLQIAILIFFEVLNNFNAEVKIADNSVVNVLKSKEDLVSLMILPNGYLACGTMQSLIRIWNVEEGILVRTLKSMTDSAIKTLAILENNDLAFGLSNGVVEIWDSTEDLLIKSIKVLDDEISSIAIMNKDIIVIKTAFEIIIFNLQTEEILNRMFSFLVQSLLVLQNDLLVSSSLISNEISIWNMTTGEEVYNLAGHTDSVSTVVLLPNGYLASGSNDRTVKIWDVNSANLVRTLKGHESKVLSLAILKNGLLASLADDGQIIIWNLDKELELKSFNSTTILQWLTVSSKGYLIGANANEIFVLNHEKFNKQKETQSEVDLGK